MPDEDQAALQFLIEHSIDVICRAAPDLRLHYVSPSSLRLLGFTPEEMIGKKLEAFISPDDASALTHHDRPDPSQPPQTVRMQKKDGTTMWAEIKLSFLCGSTNPGETIIVIHDVTEFKSLQDRISVMELIDTRTGLSTPRGFDEALEREWNRALRESSHLALLLLDFNHFRQFHDWRQHREGDRCLAKAAAAVISALRVTDLAASYGTEDIAVILPSTGSAGAAKVAEKVISAVQSLRSDPDGGTKTEGWVAVRVGIAAVRARPGATARMPELLRIAADNALQRAKRRDQLTANNLMIASPLAVATKNKQLS
jgi:diguanylate cyclase (GGDEF)-like protein/PAS domain S-box-containing protein